MFAEIPYIIDILVVVVVVQTFCCWYFWKCCKKANEAWEGVKDLFEWANALQLNKVLKCLSQATGCKGDDPTWPPSDPGDFPPENGA